jgi:photosystem II stability/assembly factor-like uncharacterized protein
MPAFCSRYILLPLLLILATVPVAPRPDGWKNPLPQGNALHSVSVVGTGTIFASGDHGTIVRSTDQGLSWTLLSTGTAAPLRGIDFTDENTGTAVGDVGLILRTTDGGATWVEQHADSALSLHGVCFTTSLLGTAVGYPAAILRTTNGGTTWTPQLSGGVVTIAFVRR